MIRLSRPLLSQFKAVYRLPTRSFSSKTLVYNTQKPEFDEHIVSNQQELDQLRKIEVIKGFFQGTGLLILLFGGFAIYNDYERYKTRFKNLIYGEIQINENEKEVKKLNNEYLIFSNDFKDSKTLPGVYLWGSNVDGLINSKSDAKFFKIPQRLEFFNGLILKDLKINNKTEDAKDNLNIYIDKEVKKVNNIASSGFAIDENGDLIQWGKGFDNNDPSPKYTLKGQGLIKGEFSNNLIYLLNNKDELIYLPIEKSSQESFHKNEKHLFGFKNKTIYYDKVNQSTLNHEKIKDFKTGINHLIVLTEKFKTYVTATGLDNENNSNNNFGQFGLIEYSNFDKVPEINKLEELFLLNNEILIDDNDSKFKKKNNNKIIPRKIVQIATGNYHTLARDSIGNVYAFGKNTFGQLGFPVNYNTEKYPIPKKIDYFISYFNRLNYYPIVTDIQAGDNSSFVTITTKNIQEVFQNSLLNTNKKVNGDQYYFGFGNGLYGQLGLDYYIHANSTPKKLSALLHGLEEFDENSNSLKKILVNNWSIGKNHTFLTLENGDIFGFGSNKFGQLGNGKLINTASPINLLKIVEIDDCLKKPKKDLKVKENEKVLNLTKFVNNKNNRLILLNDEKFDYVNKFGKKIKNLKLNQKIVAGNEVSAIYYEKCK